jgi:predicted phosphate transport protein (TIGR00153 family)
MVIRLLPRDERFFELFTELATKAVDAARNLMELFARHGDDRWATAEVIKGLEHEADEITHAIVSRLDRTFITPFDREDIHELASKLDDVVDRIDATARRSRIFRVTEVPEGALLLAEVVHRCAVEVLRAIEALEKGPPATMLASCREIKRLEEEGDAVYHHWLGKLFEDQTDPLTVIKWKELYDTLEKTLDSAEDAANVLESVTIKHG